MLFSWKGNIDGEWEKYFQVQGNGSQIAIVMRANKIMILVCNLKSFYTCF